MDDSSSPRPAFKPPLAIRPAGAAVAVPAFAAGRIHELSFRRIVHELGGVGLTTTDLVNARGMLARKPQDAVDDRNVSRRAAVCRADLRRRAGRCCATRPSSSKPAACHSVDINMGCPVDRITRGGAGASMMCRPTATIALVRQVVEAVSIPVTVKMRLGWDSTQITAPKFAREFEQAGVAAVAIHGRTREQGFSGQVDRDGIRRVVEAVERIPVIGNGDIRTIADAARMLSETGCAGISIGRGASANPWISGSSSQWEETGRYDPPGNFEERLALLQAAIRLLGRKSRHAFGDRACSARRPTGI